MKENYNSLKEGLEREFEIKTKEQEEILQKHWKKFNDKKLKLEKMVTEAFEEFLKGFELPGAKIISFGVEYHPELKSNQLGIKIRKIQIYNENCDIKKIGASIPDRRLDPEVKKFREKYNINYIGAYPNCFEYLTEEHKNNSPKTQQ